VSQSQCLRATGCFLPPSGLCQWVHVSTQAPQGHLCTMEGVPLLCARRAPHAVLGVCLWSGPVYF
jgi:hypothetical protein